MKTFKYTTNKEFVTYEQALALKELGFDEPCFNHYSRNGELRFEPKFYSRDMKSNHYSLLTNSELNTIDIITAPLKQQAFRWFREKHNMFVEIKYLNGLHDYTIISNIFTETVDFEDGPFQIYDEMESTCINKLIELIKK